MRVLTGLFAGLIVGTISPASFAWENDDRAEYNNKMALLGVLLEGAYQRAGGDLQTLCLLIGISRDVTEQYLNAAPEDAQIQIRLRDMRQDLDVCLEKLKQARDADSGR